MWVEKPKTKTKTRTKLEVTDLIPAGRRVKCMSWKRALQELLQNSGMLRKKSQAKEKR